MYNGKFHPISYAGAPGNTISSYINDSIVIRCTEWIHVLRKLSIIHGSVTASSQTYGDTCDWQTTLHNILGLQK